MSSELIFQNACFVKELKLLIKCQQRNADFFPVIKFKKKKMFDLMSLYFGKNFLTISAIELSYQLKVRFVHIRTGGKLLSLSHIPKT